MKLLRRLMALALLIFIGIGFYVTVKGFSGYDPLAVDSSKVLGSVTFRGKEILSDTFSQLPIKQAKKIVPKQEKPVYLKVGLLSDSHADIANLQRALAQAKSIGAEHIIALGDYSTVGTVNELLTTKSAFDTSGLPYSLVPGDHDLWENKAKGERASLNFETVFGEPYSYLELKGVSFLLVNNANNESGLTPDQMTWIEAQLAQVPTKRTSCPNTQSSQCVLPYFAAVHEAFFHPTTNHIMGRLSAKADEQRVILMGLFADAGVSEVISGDIHFFTRFTEPQTKLKMTTMGAVTDERNPQKPRFGLLTVYTDGTYDITDHVIAQ